MTTSFMCISAHFSLDEKAFISRLFPNIHNKRGSWPRRDWLVTEVGKIYTNDINLRPKMVNSHLFKKRGGGEKGGGERQHAQCAVVSHR